MRRLLVIVIAVSFLALLVAPLVVVAASGWLDSSPSGERGDTGIELWALAAVAYVAWVGVVVALFVWVSDLIGSKYTPPERDPRAPGRTRRRRTAGLHYLEQRERARAEAQAQAARAARRTLRQHEQARRAEQGQGRGDDGPASSPRRRAGGEG
jgi:hypothetical protein